jgi:cyclic pyranopterin phosphate synthase
VNRQRRKTEEGRRKDKDPTPTLSHVDKAGRIRMVDVTEKAPTAREAVARGYIGLSAEALRQVRAGGMKKGDPLETARLAGIMAAKQTSSLIPLCHPLPISHVDVQITPARGGYDIEARVRTTATTGVDMVKAVDRGMVIGDIRLMAKTGGKSGPWKRSR